MQRRKTLALAATLLGVILAVAGPLWPGGVHLVPNDPPRSGHVTELLATPDGAVLAGTQTGEIWRLRDGVWARLGYHLDDQPVTALLGEPGRAPVGTAAGLYFGPPGAAPLRERVSSLLATDRELLAGTANGVRRLAEGVWRPLEPQANVYCLHHQPRRDGDWLHAGTIGAGVLSAPLAEVGSAWRPNSEGLPDGAKVFVLVTAQGGELLAGTDQGLFWQARPGAVWQPLHPALAGHRILALHLDAPGAPGGTERLWIGGDDGLWWVEIAWRGEALISLSDPRPADSAEYRPPFGISRIVSDGQRLLVAAGAVHVYGPTQLTGWYWISLAGVLLILIAGWLMPRPGEATPADG